MREQTAIELGKPEFKSWVAADNFTLNPVPCICKRKKPLQDIR
jgi:hypothetical protein